jgi:hypothetical protein
MVRFLRWGYGDEEGIGGMTAKDEGGRMKAEETVGFVFHPSSFLPIPISHPYPPIPP